MAASFMAPEPQFQDSWFSPYLDIPRRGLKQDSWTSILIELTVNTQGTAVGCEANVVHGNPNMGPYTCKRMMSRARLRPARDAAGNKVYGVYRTAVKWWIGPSKMPDVEKLAHFRGTTGKLPPGMKAPALVTIQFEVDAAGRIGGCDLYRYNAPDWHVSDQDRREAEQLAPLACGLMTKTGSIRAAKTRGGEPVASIQIATIRLEPTNR